MNIVCLVLRDKQPSSLVTLLCFIVLDLSCCSRILHPLQEVDFKKGDTIAEYNGEVLSRAELDARYGQGDENLAPYAIALQNDESIDAALLRGIASIINHQSLRKTNAELAEYDGKIYVIATKNIRKHQEIYVNYGPDYTFDGLQKTTYVRPSRMPEVNGGDLQTKRLLKASYQPDKLDLEGWVHDKAISSGYNNVFHSPQTNETTMTIAGTSSLIDWKNNFVYAVGGNKAYKQTERFKSAEKVFNKATEKYGEVNLLAHSQGAISASLLGRRASGSQVTTYNRATAPGVKTIRAPGQIDLRSNGDVVSSLNKNNKSKTLNTKRFLNPVKNHSINRMSKNEY